MIGAATLCLLLIGGQGKRPQQPLAPEFLASKADWIQKPVSLKSLKGKVVLVDFWAYTCVNCIRTFPYLNEWYRRYHDKGFEIVAIQTPEFGFEGERANVIAATHRFGFQFPVLNDPQSRNWKAYGIDAWPTKILLDAGGHEIARHVGEGSYEEMESQIQRALMSAHPGLKLSGLMKPVRPTDAPGAVCQPMTLETYTGLEGISERMVPYGTDRIGKKTTFSYPMKRYGGVYFQGSWTPQASFVQGEAGSALKLPYQAKEVDSVLQTASGPVSVEVWQDGRPADPSDLGDDLHMVGGVAVLRVTQPRMYSILRNRQWGRHELELRELTPGLRVYTFTFGTDCRPLPRPGKR